MDGLQGKTLLKWMIWGYPYIWKHPFGIVLNHLVVNFFSSLTPLKLKRWKPKIRLVQKVFLLFKRSLFLGEPLKLHGFVDCHIFQAGKGSPMPDEVPIGGGRRFLEELAWGVKYCHLYKMGLYLGLL